MKPLDQLASYDVLDSTYGWLYRRRRDFPANADFWALRFSWAEERKAIRSDLLGGRYRFAPLSRVTPLATIGSRRV